MKFKSAIIIFLVNYGAFLFSQNLQYSREFERIKKNLPIAILNNHPEYFHVLRYNRVIHDFTLERRKKTSAEICAFTALRLDSVNADWFDYSNLDYIFHEYQHQIYFIFEKIQNTKREIFLKTIDTSGKSSGFKLLATLENAGNIVDLEFKLKLIGQNKLLIMGSKEYLGGSVKKFAELINLETKQQIWLKNLPIENDLTGYSTSFNCNNKGDLFYVLLKSQIDYFKRVYQDHRQIQVPVFIFESIDMLSYNHENTSIVKKTLPIYGINKINSISIYPNDTCVSLFMHFAKGETPQSEAVFFMTKQWTCDLSGERYYMATPLSTNIDKSLTYYDGSDYKTAADKEFVAIDKLYPNETNCEISQHKVFNYDEELLFIEWNKSNGHIIQQQLVPRRASFYDERAKLKNIGRPNCIINAQQKYVVILESRANEKLELNNYKHKSFKKLKTVYKANLMMYTITAQNELKKELIYQSDEFDSIPLDYKTNQNEFILFFDGSKKEKFAILKVSPN